MSEKEKNESQDSNGELVVQPQATPVYDAQNEEDKRSYRLIRNLFLAYAIGGFALYFGMHGIKKSEHEGASQHHAHEMKHKQKQSPHHLKKQTLEEMTARLNGIGFKVMSDFSVEGMPAMRGFTVTYNGQGRVVYANAINGSLVVGDIVNAENVNLSLNHRDKYLEPAMSNLAYEAIKKDATWFKEGADSAPVKIYSFTDPNCPYCLQFWENTRELVSSGKIQVRQIPVGLFEHSKEDAASILGSKNPSEKYDGHMEDRVNKIKSRVQGEYGEKELKILESNYKAFVDAGARGTPYSLVEMPDGTLHRINGSMPKDEIEDLISQK